MKDLFQSREKEIASNVKRYHLHTFPTFLLHQGNKLCH